MDTIESTTGISPDRDILQLLAEYGQLSQEYQALAAPRLAQIDALKAALAEETAHLTFQMETLKSLISPTVLASKQTIKVPFVTVIYQPRDKWDRDILLNIAKEVPAVLTAHQDSSFVQFRATTR